MVHLQSTLPHPQTVYLREMLECGFAPSCRPCKTLQQLITEQPPPAGCTHPPRCQALRHHSSHLRRFKLPSRQGLRGIWDEQTDGDMDSYSQVELRGTSKLPAFTPLPTLELGLLFCPVNWACPRLPDLPRDRRKKSLGVWSPGCMPATRLGRSLRPASGWGLPRRACEEDSHMK